MSALRSAGEAEPDGVPVERAVPDAPEAGEGFETAAAGAGSMRESRALFGAEAAPPLLEAGESREQFGYLFPDAAELGGTDKRAALEALAAAMIEQGEGRPGDRGDAEIAPVVTYMGQFIDHDITARTNTDDIIPALRIGGGGPIRPANRSLVVTAVKNLRKGSLQLDSLYGDGPIPGPMSMKLQAALRDPADPDRMRVGELSRLGGADFPIKRAAGADNRLDLPRVGSIVGSLQFPDPASLPKELRPKGANDPQWDRRAFIGDSRNDENLIVAQTHLAFLRLHNHFVDRGQNFADARRSTTWHYQWLIVNDYLPAICHAETLAKVIADEAPIYRRFYEARKAGLPAGSLPMPLEFSAAAFRFGHSMVRGEYDWNINFTRGPDGQIPATFDLLFAFTGNDKEPFGPPKTPTLPDNWPIDWARFTDQTGPGFRRARKIDTLIAPPLANMANEAAGFKHLAARNLLRGHVFHLPSAQALIAAMNDHGFGPMPVLNEAAILSGSTGAAIDSGGFARETPLWFYLLKEAEELGVGGRLGPLGTRIIAETLVGLIVSDQQSYWRRPGRRWSPGDAAGGGRPPIRSMPDLFRAAGVMQ